MATAAQVFRIFVSSTFTDLKAERDHLHDRVFPRLRSLCQKRGARFQAIDLRWGVSEEASLDQQTMPICLSEVARCQQTTPRPNFIVLLGDRYGWRPLPATIPAAEFEALSERLTDPERECLREWYRRDDNDIPPACVLQPRTGVYEDEETWAAVERLLHALFRAALERLPPVAADRQRFELSAVEQEIRAGALAVADAKEHVFCFLRRIVDVPRDSSASGFVDLVKLDPTDPTTWTSDRVSETRVEALKETLRRELPGHCFEYEVKWAGSGAPAGTTLDHLDKLGEDVYAALAGVIDTELAKVEAVDELEQEIRAHARFGAERARTFVGRADIIARITDYLAGAEPQPLVVHGAPGSGKSALLASTAEQARAARATRGVFVARFIGATPDSSDVRSLLFSVCREISRAYGADEGELPTDYRGLAQGFPKCLALATADQPLVVILDALDQLSDTDNARGLAWLPTELPPHVSLVVSTLDGECLEVLANVLPNRLAPMTAMTAAEGDALLHLWLSRAGRTLQDDQRDEVLGKFVKEGLPLYLRLAFEEARRWPSFMPAARTVLSRDVPGLIHALFDRLASRANHGTVLVARSLGDLAAARNGLTEDELVDVLSPPYDNEVLSDFRKRSPKSPAVGRLPVVLWSRLYFDLAPYLIERSADGTSLLAFYHRQFHEAAEQAYLGAQDGSECHRRLAAYFSSQQLEYTQDDQRVSNLRALAELPHQQTHGELWPALLATLTDFRFLQAKATTGRQVQRVKNGEVTVNYTGIYDLQADFELALKRWPGEASL
jgi:NACHT domain- and WD repeat-containing protein